MSHSDSSNPSDRSDRTRSPLRSRSVVGSLAAAGAVRAETAAWFAQPLSWPLLPVPDADGRLQWPSLDDSVRDSIRVLLATIPGEQLQHPRFGVGLERDLQRPNQVATRADITRRIAEAIKNNEPRVNVELVDVTPEDGGRRLRVEIRYRIVATGVLQRLSVAASVADAVPQS
jgi:phage baseplate assembly protein W